MYQLYYRPEDAWVGDIMPCYHDGEYYMYYQCDHRKPKGYPDCEPFGWSLSKSKDMIHFTDYGEVLKKDPEGGREQWLFAGSVIRAYEKFWAFYTARCHAYFNTEIPAERTCIAVSEDGINWEKHPEWMLPKPEGYESNLMRDPWVFYEEENSRWVLITPQRKLGGPAVRRGSITYFTSQDLKHWEFQGDLLDAHMYHLNEMPDLFRIGEWWYLFYSEYSDARRTHYRRSRSLMGPWETPPRDCLDGRCLYAARTLQAGDVRYLFGWNPTRDGERDLGAWVWGGNTILHELTVDEQGYLGVKLPEIYREQFCEAEQGLLCRELRLADLSGRNAGKLAETDDFYRLDLKLSFSGAGAVFGIRICVGSDGTGYEYRFSAGESRVCFDKTPGNSWNRLQNRDLYQSVCLKEGKEYEINLIVDGDVCVLYVDGVALGARMCEHPGNSVELYICDGSVQAEDIVLYEIS